MKFLAFCVKGLEKVVKDEIIRTIDDAKNIEVQEKLVVFETTFGKWKELVDLKTVDDICAYIGEVELRNGLNHKTLGDEILQMSFHNTLEAMNRYREFKEKQFSLTVSLPNTEGLNTNKFKDDFAQIFAKDKGWGYLERDHENLDIRIFLGETSIFVGVRLTQKSLHDRQYKEFFKRGSLRPTIAAAMVSLATKEKTGNFADTFCGSGTLLCEAYLKGNQVYGSDIDKTSVHFSKENLKRLDYDGEDNVNVSDAKRTLFKNEFFDFAASNLPWGKQIEVESITETIRNALNEYKRILKKDASLCLLTKHPEMVESLIAEIFPKHKTTSFQISLVGQQPTMIVASI